MFLSGVYTVRKGRQTLLKQQCNYSMTSCVISAVKGEFGNNGVCLNAPDLVKILKVSRRWEGEEGKEAERTAGAKAHGGRKHCIVEKLRQTHMDNALRTGILHKVLTNIREMDMRLPSAHKAAYRETVLGSLQSAYTQPIGSIARHRMHGAGN